MQRNPADSPTHEFDVLIIGAGAFGAAAARDAALRGLRTALIERADFGGATSAECFKMVHGGIRYLQHADVPRLRASCHERSALLRIAPHLVHPLPIAIPTYGHGRRGRAFLGAGATRIRPAHARSQQRHPRSGSGRSAAPGSCRARDCSSCSRICAAPDLSGAVVFEDGQMYNPARLVLAFVKLRGRCRRDGVQLRRGDEFPVARLAVCGVRARDRLSGEEFDVRARLTLNAAGPWADYLQNDPQRFGAWRRLPFSRDAYFIVDRAPTSRYGVAVQGLSRDKDAVLGRATRHLFAAPWRDKTLLGVWHTLFPEFPDGAHVEPDEIDTWIAELNAVYPALQLSPSEVTFANCGLVPFGETATATELSFGKESRLIDHRATHGVSGLVSLVGIRFTTARADAARALELLLRQSRARRRRADTAGCRCRAATSRTSQHSKRRRCARTPAGLDAGSLRALLRNHGTQYAQVLRERGTHDGRRSALPGTTTLRAEIGHAVEHEMAVQLEDVVMRRTDLAAGSHPGRPRTRRDSSGRWRSAWLVGAAHARGNRRRRSARSRVILRAPRALRSTADWPLVAMARCLQDVQRTVRDAHTPQSA